jgi:hypothetical protein
MRTASCLTLIAIGAIFTFAVTADLSFLNLQIAGVVLMATGVTGMLLPRRGQQGWLRRRTILRRGPRGRVFEAAAETVPDLPADGLTAEQDAVLVDDAGAPAVASEVVEEYVVE